MPFPANISKNIGKNVNESLSSKYSQIRLDHDKEALADALKTVSITVIWKTAEETGNLIGKKSPQYNSDTDSQIKKWTEISKNISNKLKKEN